MFKLRTPQSKTEFEHYYDLRWRILRAPWQQPRDSERDQHEDNAIHAMALNDEGHILGVARLHQINNTTAQIRYMAVEDRWQHSGIGDALLRYLEEQASALGVRLIKLNARENSVGVYTKRGYKVTGPGHLLYGEIKHQKLEKRLDN
ncbi:MAG: GNAT family N-acetyltransferase [Halobacteria archaeon]|nr:GNAT family N-acetyltransferase [Halobacteria archaeon]